MGSKVFNQSIGTATRQNVATKDNAQIMLGALNTSSMDQPDALAGPNPGVDTKLINGDMGEWVWKNRQTQIYIDDTRIIDGKLSERVIEDVAFDYWSNRDLHVHMSDSTKVDLDRDLQVLGKDEENYAVHREITEPVQFEWKGADMVAKAFGFDNTVLDIATAGLSLEAKTIGVGGTVIEVYHKAIAAKVEELRGHANALIGKAGLAVKVEPDANAGPTVSTSAPLGA
jgi:hypothetical protein